VAESRISICPNATRTISLEMIQYLGGMFETPLRPLQKESARKKIRTASSKCP